MHENEFEKTLSILSSCKLSIFTIQNAKYIDSASVFSKIIQANLYAYDFKDSLQRILLNFMTCEAQVKVTYKVSDANNFGHVTALIFRWIFCLKTPSV